VWYTDIGMQIHVQTVSLLPCVTHYPMQAQFTVPKKMYYLKFFPELGPLQVCTKTREGMQSSTPNSLRL